MSELEVEIVIDQSILDDIFTAEKYYSFLKYWIVENKTKAVVALKSWNDFFKYWEDKLRSCSEEIKLPFFASIRGIVTPYREKYALEAGLDTNNENGIKDSLQEETFKIVNRHYATIKYLIVENPLNYRGKGLRISDERIVTLKEFYNSIETTNSEFIQGFLIAFSRI